MRVTSFLRLPALIWFSVASLAAQAAGEPEDRAFRYNNRGMAYLEQYEFRPAAEEFEKALKIKPDFVPALVNSGIAYYYLTDYPKAAEQFLQVTKIDPGQPHANFMLGVLRSKEKDREKALTHFEKVLAVDPGDPATHYNLGLLYSRNREYDSAIQAFQRVLAVEPYHVSALYNLAMTLMRSGKQEESRQAMARFQQLKSGDQGGGPMGAMGVQYGEEGRYALGIGQYDIEAVKSEAPPIRFIDSLSAAGIQFSHGGPGRNPLGIQVKKEEWSTAWALKNLVAGLGSGAAFLDYDLDGNLDVALLNAAEDSGSSLALFRNLGGGKFKDVTAEAGINARGLAMGIAVGDYDNDTYPDIYVTAYGRNSLLHNEKNGKFADITESAQVGGTANKWSLSAAFVDYDHDGDLDIYVTNFADILKPPETATFIFPDDFPGQPNLLFRNNGDATFKEVAAEAKVAGGDSKSTGVLFTDFNNSRDIDLLVSNYRAAPFLFSNNRNGTFSEVARETGLDSAFSMGGAAGDVNKDGFTDLAFPAGRAILKNAAGKKFSANGEGSTSTAPTTSGFTWSSQLIDFNNDGWLDVLQLGEKSRLLLNGGATGWTDVSEKTGIAGFELAQARSAAVGDYDADGDPDLLITRNGGAPLLLRNDGGNTHQSLRVQLSGLRDNKSGLGAKLEVRAGQSWQKFEVDGNCTFLSQGGGHLLVGLGQRKMADSIRILWPTGVLQAELDKPAGQAVKIEEVDRKGTSCPLLYAWNGAQYQFVTDFLGGSAVGYLVAPGQYGSTDVDEYVKLAGVKPRPVQGRYSIKVNNQLEEVMFIDELKLVAVDHPADVDVFPDEKLMPAPPYPDFKLYTSRDARPPVAASDDAGQDVLAHIREVDRKYPDAFELLPFKGYSKEHWIELDLGHVDGAKQVLLLMSAWIDYADSSSNLAASQSGAKLIPPYLQVPDENGHWVTAIPSMGFPAGLPKTMTVDLTGKFRRPGDGRVRIVTSMRIYWDQILVDTSEPAVHTRVTRLNCLDAQFQFYGYPREVKPDGKNPPMYSYHERSLESPWKNHLGNYTRYGSVRPLLEAQDDKYVIMRHGDEITAEFRAGELPPLPQGWTRTFLVYAAGFGKDMDLNSANADTVGPLPSHSGEYPDTPQHREYREKYNTRRITRQFE